MNALILSGGFGTRLRPLTFSCPKPVIPFCNIPIMEHQIKALVNANVAKIILAVSDNPFYSKVIRDFRDDMERKYGIKIVISVEKTPLGTAGPLLLAEEELTSENFYVLNSDVTCSYPLAELLKFHVETGAEASILTTKVEDPSKYGVIISEEDGRVKEFVEKPKEFVGDQINAGVYCLNRSILKKLEKRKMSIEKEVFPVVAKEGKLFSYKLAVKENFWMDIGQPKDYLKGTKIYLKSKNITHLIGENCKIAKSAKIGKHSVLGEGCEIEDGVQIEDSVIFSGTKVKSGVVIRKSIIGWDCTVEKSSVVNESILEKEVTVKEKSNLDRNVVCSHKTVEGKLEAGKIVL